jgi:hypothetical protein
VTLAAPWRKLVLVFHVMTSVGFLGAVVVFLALAVTGATAADSPTARSAYIAMQLVTSNVIVPLAIATLVIGLVQSLGTPWGLFRHYWVVIKLALGVIALLVLAMQIPTIDLLAETARSGPLLADAGARYSMILHSAGGVVVLVAASVLSVFKPRGLTPYGAWRLSAASEQERRP